MTLKQVDIVLTGGGSAGHVMPHLAILPDLVAQGHAIHYIGSHQGIEAQLVADANIPYSAITTTKLRRELTFKNAAIPVQLLRGVLQAKRLLKQLRPKVVFSKGGYVALPVVYAASQLNIPIIAHESDLTPGLANRLSAKYVDHIALSFSESQSYFKQAAKTLYTGAPIRENLLQGDRHRGLAVCNFETDKPVLLVWGGGAGSQLINTTLRASLEKLCTQFQIVHICGKDKRDRNLDEHPDYIQFEYLKTPLADVLACADIMVGRGGSNTLFEMLALQKPHLLIPLGRVTRGDQIQNAEYFKTKGVSQVLLEAQLTPESLVDNIKTLYVNRENTLNQLRALALPDGRAGLLDLLARYL